MKRRQDKRISTTEKSVSESIYSGRQDKYYRTVSVNVWGMSSQKVSAFSGRLRTSGFSSAKQAGSE